MLRRHADYTGLDLSPERFVGAIRGGVTALPFASEFDAIVCSHVLEHIPDEAAAIASLFGAQA